MAVTTAASSVKPVQPTILTPQQEEDKFFSVLLATDEVEVMPLDACTAASLGHIEQLTRFSAGDLDTANRSGWTPLMYAACLGHTSTVQYLGRRRVSCSCYAGKSEAGNVEGRQQTALMLAAANGHDESVSALLALPDCKANAVDTRGWTALFYAIAYGHPSTAELLLKNGADPNIPENSRLASPLVVAAESGHDDIIRILLRHGADINQKTRDGCLPIDVASFRGHVQVVSLLHRAQSKLTRPLPSLIPPPPQVAAAGESAKQKPSNGLNNIVDGELAKLLTKLGLEHYAKDFAAGAITCDTLMHSTEEDLRLLPFLTVGARKQLMLEITARQSNKKDISQTDAEVAKILIPTLIKSRNPNSTFAHFLGHVSVLVANCSLLGENQKVQLTDVVASAVKQIQLFNNERKPADVGADQMMEQIVGEMEAINAYFDAFLAQS